jgi:hypothetical protein
MLDAISRTADFMRTMAKATNSTALKTSAVDADDVDAR